MRGFLVTIASAGLFATAVQAADSSPVAGQLPDTPDHYHVYLFSLKKNGYSIKIRPADFCQHMQYGKAIFSHQDDDVMSVTDQKLIMGDLDWVICRFTEK